MQEAGVPARAVKRRIKGKRPCEGVSVLAPAVWGDTKDTARQAARRSKGSGGGEAKGSESPGRQQMQVVQRGLCAVPQPELPPEEAAPDGQVGAVSASRLVRPQ